MHVENKVIIQVLHQEIKHVYSDFNDWTKDNNYKDTTTSIHIVAGAGLQEYSNH